MTYLTDHPDVRRVRAIRLALRAGTLVLVVLLIVTALGGATRRARAAVAHGGIRTAFAGSLSDELDAVRGDLAVARLQLDRAQAILNYSAKYQIPGDLSGAIYDAAIDAGIDPAIGYRLVQVESNFKRDAVSSANAIGYTQIQLATARSVDPKATEHQLLDRDTNLRLGFRYLKRLLGDFDHDLRLALLAYNRGPNKVEQILAEGGNPSNGYARTVLKDYRRPGGTEPAEVR